MSTLQNFGVPQGGGAGRGRILQPKAKYKFRVNVYGFGPVATPLDLTAQVQSVGRPNRQNNAVEVHSYNSVAYYAGKGAWNPIDLVVRDDVTNAVSRLVGHQEQKQMNHFAQTTPLAGSNYKFNMKIETLDGGNDGVLEVWDIEGCWLESINWDNFDYTSVSEFVTIQMSVKFDNATQTGGIMPRIPQFNNFAPLV